MEKEEFDYLSNRRSDIRLRALMNRMYYQERQSIFEFRDGAAKAISLISGSIAFANVANPMIVKWAAAAVTITGIASLVFGFGNKARESAKRSAEWALLERDMESTGERDFTEQDLNDWAARCNEIEAGEPAPHPGLLERCYLRACAALGSTPSPSKLSLWQRIRPAMFIP
jgi:hypothetical protein